MTAYFVEKFCSLNTSYLFSGKLLRLLLKHTNMGTYKKLEFVSIENLGFRIYTDEEIKKMSVMKITNPETFNSLGHISSNGLYDLHLGPIGSNDDLCATCRLRSTQCSGHCGHMDLPLPVYNPVLYDALRNILSRICFSCCRFIAKKEKVLQLPYQMKLLRLGYVAEALELDDYVSQIVACSKVIEAEEVYEGVSKNKRKSKSSATLPPSIEYALPLKLESYMNNVISKGSAQNVTSHVNNVRDFVLGKFWKECGSFTCCPFCTSPLIKLALMNSRFMKKNAAARKVAADDDLTSDSVDSQSFLTPKQIQMTLRKCWKNDKVVLSSLYPILSSVEREYPTDLFFLNTLLVIPPKFRPYNRMRDGLISEHESTTLLKSVLRLSRYLMPLLSVMNGTLDEIPSKLQVFYKEIKGKTYEEKCQNMWYQIQCNVNNIYDANLNHLKQETPKGIRQLLEKKGGLMRHNLMGKRVNFSARSVAAPDPYLAIDEVGVPMDFATKLSFPVCVTDWNIEEMRRLVTNGPDKYPGALLIEDEEGKKVHLGKMDQTQRSALAKKLLTPLESHIQKVNAQKIVYRQLKNGDYVLINRQPTLHRPSIQAHRVRVMPKDRVLRMPYANCKAYNADFDGDEFNMHFPQNEYARSEAKHLITTQNQYLTPKDGSPLAGLIQDSVVSSVKITMRGNFFNREDYQQLVYASLPDHHERIVCLPPCILKPQQLWSGKQVISTLLHNVIPLHKAKPSFTFKTSVKVDIWQTKEARTWRGGGEAEKKREALTESEFVMLDGELLSGVIDKCAIGSTSYGLIHTCYDLYGGPVAYKLLTAINRLCVYYLQWAGHTITVKDFVTPKHASKSRKEALSKLIEEVPTKVVDKLSISESEFRDYFESAHMSNNAKNMAAIDAAYTSSLGPTTSNVTAENEKQLLRPNLDNQMKMMVDTGAKGSKVNMNQMASLFGSVAVDGKRMPLGITGKSLPSFKPYDVNPCAGGYIPNRFMTGINPKSYFFLCIVGRDSLQHTAVKTADSGYVQRCLIKHLEGIRVDYDMTVRNSDGVVLQFSYGEDGLDVSKVPFMSNLPALDVLVTNYSKLIDSQSLLTTKAMGNPREVQSYLQKLKGKQKRHSPHVRQSGFLRFCKKFGDSIDLEGFSSEIGRSSASLHLQKMWHSLLKEEKEKYIKKVKRCPDPVDSVFCGVSNLGVVSEALDNLIDQYYDDCYSKRSLAEQKLSREEVKRTVHMKAIMSKADPGEAVGALCAQALGEPLTQMTLNTFHFAGKDELNVTLGVPRMIEILRTGSKEISTPIMEVPFHPHVSKEQAERLRLALSEVPLSKVLSSLRVKSRLAVMNEKLQRVVKIRLSFLPRKQFKHLFAVTSPDILNFVEKYFFLNIVKEIFKSFKQQKQHSLVRKEEREVNKASSNVENLEDQEQYITENVEEKVDDEGLSDDSDGDHDDGEGARKNHARDSSDEDYEEEEYQQEEETEPAAYDEQEEEKLETDEFVNWEEHSSVSKKKKKASVFVDDETAEKRMFNLKSICPVIVDYEFDREKQLWCEAELSLPVADGAYDIVSIVREISEHSFVRRVNGIRRVVVVEKDNQLMLRTEGVNILKIYAHENLLDINRLYTNNIHQVAEKYGIEAAQRSVIREIRAVQSAYDIKVDFRHLSLLADYFTCEGVYKACSRGSIATCASPLQKMSFETTAVFLKSALMLSELENMTSPSSDIAVGQPPKIGTNIMQVRQVCR